MSDQKSPPLPAKTIDLRALAGAINSAHEACSANLRKSADEALKCGKLLLDVKKRLNHGNFRPWMEKNLSFSIRTAERYMARAKPPRLAKNDIMSFLKEVANDEMIATDSTEVSDRVERIQSKAATSAGRKGLVSRGNKRSEGLTRHSASALRRSPRAQRGPVVEVTGLSDSSEELAPESSLEGEALCEPLDIAVAPMSAVRAHDSTSTSLDDLRELVVNLVRRWADERPWARGTLAEELRKWADELDKEA